MRLNATRCTTLSRASNPEYAEAGSTGQAGVRQVTVWVVFAANVKRATRQHLAEVVQPLVERVPAKGRTVDPESIEWTPLARSSSLLRCFGAPGRIRTADASLRTAALYPLSYGGAASIVPVGAEARDRRCAVGRHPSVCTGRPGRTP